MNKNVLLGAVAALAIVVVGVLLFFSPDSSVQPMESSSKTEQPKTKQNIDVIYHEKSQKKSTQIKKQSPKKAKKKVDPTIKAAAIDHYHKYLIQLIDENPEDKDLKLENKPGTYVYVEGKVDGKEYVLKVPKSVVTRPGIKLKITDLKTKKSTELDASFLSEAASLPIGSTFRANIDTRNPNSVQTDVELPEENPAFPTFRE